MNTDAWNNSASCQLYGSRPICSLVCFYHPHLRIWMIWATDVGQNNSVLLLSHLVEASHNPPGFHPPCIACPHSPVCSSVCMGKMLMRSSRLKSLLKWWEGTFSRPPSHVCQSISQLVRVCSEFEVKHHVLCIGWNQGRKEDRQCSLYRDEPDLSIQLHSSL